MHIVHIASELAPLAKVGGLGDVLYGLSKALVKRGHHVQILLPKYDCIQYALLKHLKVHLLELWSIDGPHRYNNTIWSAEMENLQLLLIEPHHPLYYFSRGKIYGCPDDIDRFLYFSRTALEYLHKTSSHPDILHLHDWPCAVAAVLHKEAYAAGLLSSKSVLTIHNLEHQGRCAPSHLARIGLRAELYLTADKLQDPISPLSVNLLKGGIQYADYVTTVSPNYEKEIQTPEGGCGLHEVLRAHQSTLRGILNGIDETFWNPEGDPHLVQHYRTQGAHSLEQLEQIRRGKAANRKHLNAHLGLREGKGPLVACITRLVLQKGPHLIKHALLRTIEKGGQFVLLGATHPGEIAEEFSRLKAQLADHPDVAIVLDSDEALAHLIYASADMQLIPSLFEPCGLTQMIALRYGTIPIARATGGLVDTVFDVDTSAQPPHKRNGFTFEFPDEIGVNWALDRALQYWTKTPKQWLELMRQGMQMDCSWTHSAAQYEALYATVCTQQPIKTSPF